MTARTTIGFRSLSADELADVGALVLSLLPEQGCIEVQHDRAGKEHPWHTHATDETLIVLGGTLRFLFASGERCCRSGDIIDLPAGVGHGSVAGEHGATYLIAMEAKRGIGEPDA